MKNLTVFLGLILITFSFAQAQTPKLPSDGVQIKFENNQLEAKAGESISLDFKIVRSKFYQKKQTPIHLKVVAGEGINATLSPNPNPSDSGKLELSLAKNVNPGKYAIVIQKSNNSAAKVVGTILNLTVKESGVISIGN